MAYIKLYREKLKHNYNFIDALMKKYNKEWAVVSKLLCGTPQYLKELIDLGAEEICDSRVSNLKAIKLISPETCTVYIKPPAKRSVANVVKYADASFNTELDTIKHLSEEAIKQGKIHKVIIMIELGDLREGVMGEDLLDFYGQVFELKGIKVTGIGANLNCLSGTLPSQDKLIQLSLYKQLIEASFKRKIPWVTGGSSITIPLINRKQVPKGVNHFRVGETLFFGLNLLTGKPYKGMKQDVLRLYAEIIEITEKPAVPIGYMAENPSGEAVEVNPEDYDRKMDRAILDIGLLDISPDFLIPDDKGVEIVGASSDMIVLDIGNSKRKYKVGGLITFKLKYMGALRLLNSDYVEKRIE